MLCQTRTNHDYENFAPGIHGPTCPPLRPINDICISFSAHGFNKQSYINCKQKLWQKLACATYGCIPYIHRRSLDDYWETQSLYLKKMILINRVLPLQRCCTLPFNRTLNIGSIRRCNLWFCHCKSRPDLTIEQRYKPFM